MNEYSFECVCEELIWIEVKHSPTYPNTYFKISHKGYDLFQYVLNTPSTELSTFAESSRILQLLAGILEEDPTFDECAGHWNYLWLGWKDANFERRKTT